MGLVHEFPRGTMNGFADCGIGYAEFLRQSPRRFAALVSLPNLANAIRVQFHQRFACAVLCRHVLAVIRPAAEKEMSGIDARRIVAVMADVQVTGNGTMVDFPTDAMGKGTLVRSRDGDNSISSGHANARPLPAPVTFDDVLPERRFFRFNAVAPVALRGAIFPAAPTKGGRERGKGGATLKARARNFAILGGHFLESFHDSGGAAPGPVSAGARFFSCPSVQHWGVT